MTSKRRWIMRKVAQLVQDGMDITRAQQEAVQMARRKTAGERLKELKKMKQEQHEAQHGNTDGKEGAAILTGADAGLRPESSVKEGGDNASAVEADEAGQEVHAEGGDDNRGRDEGLEPSRPRSTEVRADAKHVDGPTGKRGNGNSKRPRKDT